MMGSTFTESLEMAKETIICFRSVEHPNINAVPLNFVMPTRFVDKHMELIFCRYEKIKSIDDNGVDTSVLKESTNFTETTISWQSIGTVAVNSQNSPVTFTVPPNGNDWDIRDGNRNRIHLNPPLSRANYFPELKDEE
jgi:hypothetical protein